VWAVRSWQRSLLTLVTLIGVWAIFHGVNEIFAAFTLREAGKRAERLVAEARWVPPATAPGWESVRPAHSASRLDGTTAMIRSYLASF
jgi:Short repeat of unknown function (DUF308)